MTRISLLDLYGVMFVGLKLGSVIAWSWFWVLAPLVLSLLLGGVGAYAEAKAESQSLWDLMRR